MESLYTAKVTATGGRNGHVTSADGSLDVDVRTPKEMGGAEGPYLNPEILFAGGYASCFDSALNLIIRTENVQTGTTTVTAEVTLGKINNEAYNLALTLEVTVPGVDRQKAEELVHKAHQLCPYSNATRGNVDVTLVIK